MGLFHKIFDAVARKTLAYPFFPRLDGFEDPKGINESYDYTQRKITFTHASGEVAIWHKGLRYSFASPYTPTQQHSATSGRYYLYLVDGGTPTWNASPWDWELHTPMGYVTYNDPTGIYFGIRECHGLQDWETTKELHEKMGTYKRSGGLLTAGTYATGAGGDTDLNVTPGTDQVTIADEDLPSVNGDWVQGSYTRVHFISSLAVFTTSSALPFPVNAGAIQYNSGGTSLAAMPANNTYVNVYVIYVPVMSDTESQKYRTLWMIGQSTYTSLATAQAEDPRGMNFGDLGNIFTEFVPAVQITYRYNNTYGGSGKTRIEAAPINITWSKAYYVGATGITPSTHNNLSGRTDPDCHPGTSVSLTASGTQIYTDAGNAIQHLYDKYPGFQDYVETVSGSAKTVFSTGIDFDAAHKIDVSIDGRDQPIENTNWSRDNSANTITTAEPVNVGSVFKARVYTK